MFKKKLSPASTVVELTLKCNMKCIHCGSAAGIQRKNELSTEEWINVFKDLADLDCKLVTLMGGEPFLKDGWYEIAQEIKNLGMDVTFMSNGFFINDKIIRKLRKIEPYAVTISIDGASSFTHDKIRGIDGSFNKCISSLNSLKNADLPASVITTVHKLNYKDLTDMRKFLLDKNIAWQIQIADPIGRFPKKLHLSKQEFYSVALFIASSRKKYGLKQLPIMGAHCMGYNSQVLPNIMLMPKWQGCQAGISVLGIQSDGGITGCLSLPNSYIEGNLKEKNIKEIWNSNESFTYNRKFKKEDLKGGCIDCKYGNTCKGGCLAVSVSMTGKEHSDPFCLYKIEKENS